MADPAPPWRRAFSAAFPWLAVVLLLAIVVQVFLAGVGVMTNEGWLAHTSFVHFFELVPVLMVLAAALGRRGRFAIWGSVAAFVLIGLQYPLVEARPNMAAALHAVNALLIFGVALMLTHSHPVWSPKSRAA